MVHYKIMLLDDLISKLTVHKNFLTLFCKKNFDIKKGFMWTVIIYVAIVLGFTECINSKISTVQGTYSKHVVLLYATNL